MNDLRIGRRFPLVRSIRLGAFTVRLYDLGAYDKRGQTALGYRVSRAHDVLAVCDSPEGAVYGSPMHADDSRETMAAAINLICYAESHGPNDEPKDCGWSDALGDECSMWSARHGTCGSVRGNKAG